MNTAEVLIIAIGAILLVDHTAEAIVSIIRAAAEKATASRAAVQSETPTMKERAQFSTPPFEWKVRK